ncbi:MAG: hypothetical protein OEW29_13915 [Acidimicrobiia bacterium]|nr:hypothetical protein [Acidimicrobiia bacterium]
MDRAFDSTVGAAADEPPDGVSDAQPIQRAGAGSGGPATGTAQLDRRGEPVRTGRRYLVVANQTLDDPILVETVRHRCEQANVDLHVLVPRPRRILPFCDPMMGVPLDVGIDTAFLEIQDAEEAAERLSTFLCRIAPLGATVTGEVATGDPVAHARRLLAGRAFDEIIVSALANGLARWLRIDLTARLSRAFAVPVVGVARLA